MIIKVCGITNLEDALAAVDAGANAIGLNFWPQGKRYIQPQLAEAIIARMPATVLKVGVFVKEAPAELAERIGLDVVQVHGEAVTAGVRRLWKAVSVAEGFRPELLDDPEVDAFLLDAPAGAEYGGTGRTFDWKLVRGTRRRIVLAGGLDGENVARAIEIAQPWGVDACSRLESAPGKKDHRKMTAFIEAARKVIGVTC